MRYLVTARVRGGCGPALARAIRNKALGRGSIAGDEYLRNMAQARQLEDGRVVWVETCYCEEPLDEERPYWEAYFHLLSVRDAHARRLCRHETGEAPWSCDTCTCTARLEAVLARRGRAFDPGA